MKSSACLSLAVLLALSLCLCLFLSPAYAESPPAGNEETSADSSAELRTVVPEGVTEIDLRVILGDGAAGVNYAWMLNADTCVLLRELNEAGDDEIIVLNIRDNTVLSRTPVPYATYDPEQGFSDGVFYLLMTPLDNYDDMFFVVKAAVTPDGTVNITTVPKGITVMPGGKTAIRQADGSLYAMDLKTYKMELLIQGVSQMTRDWEGASYETFLKYVPWPDDVFYDGKYEDGYPFPITFPVDENTYYDNNIYLWRDFYVYKPLDEYRFVYKVYGWEWGAGYGIYDLKTHTDHRITGRGHLCGMAGATLYGSALKTDMDTLVSSPLPASVQDQLYDATAMESSAGIDFSPDGRLMAITNTKSPYNEDASTVTVTDMETGDIKAYDIDNPFASEATVSFYDNTRFMLFFYPKENGSAYIYLIDTAE